MQGDLDNFVIIDVDTDGFDNVIIIDVPESLREKLKGVRGGKIPLTGIINIDDDDDSDGLDCNAAPTSSNTSPTSNSMQEPFNAEGDDHQLFKEKSPAFRFSKCGKNYSKKAHLRNRYGLSSESECDSHGNDSSDCEVIEGSFEELREQWERASQERKSGGRKGKRRTKDQVGPSCCTDSGASEQKATKEDLFTKQRMWSTSQFDDRKSNFENEGASFCQSDHAGEPCNLYQRRVVLEKEKGFVQASSSGNTYSVEDQPQGLCMKKGVKVVSGEKVAPDAQSSDENRSTDPSTSVAAEGIDQISDSIGKVQLYDERNTLHTPPDISAPSAQRDIMFDRESLKETDEYKRAVEEEWAARQRQLQIQAEEAQKLRKRKKAESLRILDMEKRQKQRVEEMRHTQKKDEEELNLKERLRGEIRKELNKLENTSIDMASLLRGLGIPISGGFHPLSNDVHAAYKRALLKFHPDRVSRSDVRQQVEAEEKFKLISRMKEKFQFPCS